MSSTRFITQYPNYIAQVRPQRQRALGDGSIDITQEPIYVPFKTISDGAFIFENEEAQARKQFDFKGNTQELDMATPSDILNRLAVIDTDEFAQERGLSDAEKALVEKRLQEISETTPQELFMVSTKPISAPFPRYDSFDGDPEELVARLVEDGFSLSEVLYYEETFGPKREPMIAAIQEMMELEQEHTVSA